MNIMIIPGGGYSPPPPKPEKPSRYDSYYTRLQERYRDASDALPVQDKKNWKASRYIQSEDNYVKVQESFQYDADQGLKSFTIVTGGQTEPRLQKDVVTNSQYKSLRYTRFTVRENTLSRDNILEEEFLINPDGTVGERVGGRQTFTALMGGTVYKAAETPDWAKKLGQPGLWGQFTTLAGVGGQSEGPKFTVLDLPTNVEGNKELEARADEIETTQAELATFILSRDQSIFDDTKEKNVIQLSNFETASGLPKSEATSESQTTGTGLFKKTETVNNHYKIISSSGRAEFDEATGEVKSLDVVRTRKTAEKGQAEKSVQPENTESQFSLKVLDDGTKVHEVSTGSESFERLIVEPDGSRHLFTTSNGSSPELLNYDLPSFQSKTKEAPTAPVKREMTELAISSYVEGTPDSEKVSAWTSLHRDGVVDSNRAMEEVYRLDLSRGQRLALRLRERDSRVLGSEEKHYHTEATLSAISLLAGREVNAQNTGQVVSKLVEQASSRPKKHQKLFIDTAVETVMTATLSDGDTQYKLDLPRLPSDLSAKSATYAAKLMELASK